MEFKTNDLCLWLSNILVIVKCLDEQDYVTVMTQGITLSVHKDQLKKL